MGGIKAFIVLSMAPLNLAVMSWRVGTDQFVPDAVLFQMLLKKGGLVPVGSKAVGKFIPVIGLDEIGRAHV